MPQKITRPHVVFEGRNYTLQNSGYYSHGNSRNTGGQRLLHRDVWAKANGRAVPDGCDIHHKDHNKDNNDPSNLELLSHGDHTSHHGARGYYAWDAATRGQVRSEAWERREAKPIICGDPACGRTFHSTGMRAKYCSVPCRQNATRARRNELARERDRASRRS